ncbi:UDP-2,3-diacylglucosamine diphosphatase [Uliginosibacterium sediminicola]|uniref:UDP-2,3-diacylglucosamine hydrolase n=1 Tax=Uliginosibacterium sediminicola TaxID=2024550 RepID=A0ABU9YZW5_9RHOO
MIHFISDLHLHPSRPATTSAFLSFLASRARQADTLWILGDLFEYWAGDDDLPEPFNRQIADALRAASAAGLAIKLIVGNRDFLLASAFARNTGIELIGEPHCITLGTQTAVLLHGDVLCSDDVAYLQFRAMVRNPAWQAQFLAQPLPVRHKIAEDLRAKSEMSKQGKTAEIMDVHPDAVAQAFRDSGASLMIHGHTHRPASHTIDVDGQTRIRHVLPDWQDQACGLRWDGSTLSSFSGV